MDFGDAIKAIRAGGHVSRTGWNGKGMYVFLAEGERLADAWEPCIVMRTAQARLQPGWLASQADMLADDWTYYEPSFSDMAKG